MVCGMSMLIIALRDKKHRWRKTLLGLCVTFLLFLHCGTRSGDISLNVMFLNNITWNSVRLSVMGRNSVFRYVMCFNSMCWNFVFRNMMTLDFVFTYSCFTCIAMNFGSVLFGISINMDFLLAFAASALLGVSHFLQNMF